MSVNQFRDQRPCLKDCKITSSGTRLIIESNLNGATVTFPLDRKAIVDRLDGKNTIKEILTALYSTDYSTVNAVKQKNTLGLRTFFLTLQVLAENSMLSDFESIEQKSDLTPELFDLETNTFLKPFFKKMIAPKIEIQKSSPPVFFLLSCMIVFVAVLLPISRQFFNSFGTSEPPLRFFGNYAWSVPILYLLLSCMLSFKTILKSMLVLLATRHLYQFEIKVKWYAAYFSVSDHGIFHSDRRLVVFTYQIATALMYFFAAAILGILTAPAGIHNTLYTLAVILTLFDTHPYHRSDLTKTLSLFFGERQLRHMIPYLKRRSLLALFIPSGKIVDERFYLVYSTAALLWVSVALTVSLNTLAKNIPALSARWLEAGFSDFLSRTVLLFFLSVFAIYTLSDIVITISENFLRPIASPIYHAIFGKMHSRSRPASQVPAAEKALKDVIGFDKVSAEARKFLIENSTVSSIGPKVKFIRQGAVGNELFVLLSGSADVFRRDPSGLKTKVATLNAPSIFGEIGVILDVVRTADVISAESSEVLVIKKSVFEKMISNFDIEEDRQKLVEAFSLSHYLSNSKLFSQLPSETLHLFSHQGVIEHPVANTNILNQGEITKSFYLLIDGNVAVIKNGITVADLAAGDFFGEIALIADLPRTATIRSITNCTLLRIDQDQFWNILTSHSEVAMSIEDIAEHRIEEAKCSA